MSLKPEEICKIVCGNEDTTINCIYPLSCGLVESCQKIANHYETAIIPARIKAERQKLISEVEGHRCGAESCAYYDDGNCTTEMFKPGCLWWQQFKQESE